MATSSSGAAKADDGVKFTITVQCSAGGEKRAVSYTVFKRTLMSQVFDSSVQFFKLDPAQVILVVKNKVALTHKCVEDYRLADKSVLDLIHLKEAPTIDLTLKDQAGNSKMITASTYHPLSDVVKAFCKHLGEESGFSDLYHGGIALDLDASPASIGLKTGEQLFCYCYKAACKEHWISAGKPEQAKSLRFIKFYFSDWKYGYKTFPIFRHDISTPMEVLIKTFCTWRGLDYEQTGFLYSYTYKQVQQGDTATNKALADGDTILAYSRQELQGRLWDSILAGSCSQVLDLLDQGAELSTSIGPEEWGKHPLHAAVANGHVELVKLLLQGAPATDSEQWRLQKQQLQKIEVVGIGQHSRSCAMETAVAGVDSDGGGNGEPGPRFGLAGDRAENSVDGSEAAATSDGSADGIGLADGTRKLFAGAGSCSSRSGGGRQGGTSSGGGGGKGGGAGCSSHRISLAGTCGGCDPNQLDYASDPPLWHAVENNLVGLVELLLAAGATAADIPPKEGRSKDQTGTGYSACPHAARKGHAETLRVLLAAGANPWLPDADGYTAYDYALDHAKPPAVVAALLEGDPRFAEMQRGFQAAYQRMCQMLKRTQRYPALGCPCRTCNSLLEIRAPETEASRLVREQIGCVALVRAVQAGGPHCVEVMELLFKHGALLDGQDYDGRTALHQAIRYNRLSEATWLTSKGAHLDIPDFEGLLPLHQAGCSGFLDITRLLVNAGAPLNLHTIKYVSQEQLDAQAKKQAEGHLGSKKAKRKQQLDVSGLTTIGGNSPLALAIRHGHGAIVEYLLSQNAVFDLKNAADSSAFHAALDKGSAAIAGLLLQHINKKTVMGAGAGTGVGGSGGSSSRSPTAGKGGAVSARERDKDARLSKKDSKREAAIASRAALDKDKGEGKDAAASGSEGGMGEGGGVPMTGSGPPTAPADPPVAFDAGAGLREMVLRERERLRQQLGLSTPISISGSGSSSVANGSISSSGGASATAPVESKSAPSISSRTSGSSATLAPRPAVAAAVPPPQPSTPPASLSLSSVAAASASGIVGTSSGSGNGGCGSKSSATASCNSSTIEEKRSIDSSAGNSSTTTCDSSVSRPSSSCSAGESTASSAISPKVQGGEEATVAQQTQHAKQQAAQEQQQQQLQEVDEHITARARPGLAESAGIALSVVIEGPSLKAAASADTHGDTGHPLKASPAGGVLVGETASSGASVTSVSMPTLANAAVLLQRKLSSNGTNQVHTQVTDPAPPSQPLQPTVIASSAKEMVVPAVPTAPTPVPAAVAANALTTFTTLHASESGLEKEVSNPSVPVQAAQARSSTGSSAQSVFTIKPGPTVGAAGGSAENTFKTINGMIPGTPINPMATGAGVAAAAPMVSPIKVKFRAKPVDPPAGPSATTVGASVPSTTAEIATPAVPAPPQPQPQASASLAFTSTPAEPMVTVKTRRGGRVITVPASVAARYPQPPTFSKQTQGAGEGSGAAYLTIPASLLSARRKTGITTPATVSSSSAVGVTAGGSTAGSSTTGSSGAAPAATATAVAGRSTLGQVTTSALVTAASSSLRPAALSYSPRSPAGQLQVQALQPQQLQTPTTTASPTVVTPATGPAPTAAVAASSTGSFMQTPQPPLSPALPGEAALPAGVPLLSSSLGGPLGRFSQAPHMHVQSHGGPLPVLQQPHLQPSAIQGVAVPPPPPPGFASRPPSGKPPQPPSGLSALVHAPPPVPIVPVADVAMPEMENLVLSVVDQGLEESVGVGALGDRLMLCSNDAGPGGPSRLGAGGGGLQAAGGSVAAAADSLWPHPHDLAAAALLSADAQLSARGAMAGTGGSGLLDTQPIGLRRGLRHAPAGPMGPPPSGAMHATTAAVSAAAGAVIAGGGAVVTAPFLGGSVGVAMARAQSGELAALGSLLDRGSAFAAPTGSGDGGYVALAAAGSVLDQVNDTASSAAGGGLLSRTASQHTLSRYDSGILGQSSHGPSVALFSADVWAADGGTTSKSGSSGTGATATGGLDSTGGIERRSAHGDSWAALAEAQQLQLSQAMEALANGPAAAAAAATAMSATVGAFAAPGAPGLLAFPGTAVGSLPSSAITATASTISSRADVPPPPTELEPLPDFPASLFDDDEDERNHQRLLQVHRAANGRAPEGDASGTVGTAASGGAALAACIGPRGSGPPSVPLGGPAGRPGSGGASATLDGHSPPLPTSGARPMVFGPAGPGAANSMGPGVNAALGMGVPPQVPYGHGPGVMYSQAMGNHSAAAAAAFGGGHPGFPGAGPGPYGDWFSTSQAGPYSGFRPPIMVPPSGGMFGGTSQAATMSGGRSGGMMPPPSHGPQTSQAQGSFTGPPHSHVHSHAHTLQQAQQAAAPAAALGSAWFSGGGGKAAAISGMAVRGGGSGGSSGSSAVVGTADTASGGAAGPGSGSGSGSSGGAGGSTVNGSGSNSGSGARLGHARGGKGRR